MNLAYSEEPHYIDMMPDDQLETKGPLVTTAPCKDDCGTEYLPVCGSNDRTYSNLCLLNLAACQAPEDNIVMKHPGECEGKYDCVYVV